MTELRLCPFCKTNKITAMNDGEGGFWIKCEICLATGPYTTKYDGEEDDPCFDWQSRPLEDDLQKKLDTAIDDIKFVLGKCHIELVQRVLTHTLEQLKETTPLLEQ